MSQVAIMCALEDGCGPVVPCRRSLDLQHDVSDFFRGDRRIYLHRRFVPGSRVGPTPGRQSGERGSQSSAEARTSNTTVSRKWRDSVFRQKRSPPHEKTGTRFPSENRSGLLRLRIFCTETA